MRKKVENCVQHTLERQMKSGRFLPENVASVPDFSRLMEKGNVRYAKEKEWSSRIWLLWIPSKQYVKHAVVSDIPKRCWNMR